MTAAGPIRRPRGDSAALFDGAADMVPKETFLDRARKIVLNLAALLAGTFVVGYVVVDAFSGRYEVQTIEVPSELQKVISGDEIAARLRDGMASDWRKAAVTSPISAYQKDAGEPEIVITGTNLSLRYVSKLIRRILGHSIVELSSELTPGPEDTNKMGDDAGKDHAGIGRVRLILRKSDFSANTYFDGSGPLDQVIADGALASLETDRRLCRCGGREPGIHPAQAACS